MNNRLLLSGGILCGCLTIFHIFLGWQIQVAPGLSPDDRALMQMLNVGGILIMAFATFVSLWFKRDLITTGLGKTTLVRKEHA